MTICPIRGRQLIKIAIADSEILFDYETVFKVNLKKTILVIGCKMIARNPQDRGPIVASYNMSGKKGS